MLAVDESDYYLAIFNRFGQRIFESQQPELGWDGTVNGSKCQTGVYVYLLRVLSLSGKYIEQRGVLVLLD